MLLTFVKGRQMAHQWLNRAIDHSTFNGCGVSGLTRVVKAMQSTAPMFDNNDWRKNAIRQLVSSVGKDCINLAGIAIAGARMDGRMCMPFANIIQAMRREHS